MNKKYILEYVGGTKGDMVVRFLNGVEPDISFDRANKTEPQELECENWLKLINPKDMTLERFEEVLSVNPYEYLPAHPLWCCCPTDLQGAENLLYSKYMDLLKEYDYEIMSLKFEPKHYDEANELTDINFKEVELVKLPHAPKGKKIKEVEVIITLQKN